MTHVCVRHSHAHTFALHLANQIWHLFHLRGRDTLPHLWYTWLFQIGYRCPSLCDVLQIATHTLWVSAACEPPAGVVTVAGRLGLARSLVARVALVRVRLDAASSTWSWCTVVSHIADIEILTQWCGCHCSEGWRPASDRRELSAFFSLLSPLEVIARGSASNRVLWC